MPRRRLRAHALTLAGACRGQCDPAETIAGDDGPTPMRTPQVTSGLVVVPARVIGVGVAAGAAHQQCTGDAEGREQQ